MVATSQGELQMGVAPSGLMEPDEALDRVLAATPAGRPVELLLAEATGLVLASDVAAPFDQPPFAKAMMDGFAVCVNDAGCRVRVGGIVAAGATADRAVAPGIALEIMTGAACPPGTEAVVKVEDARREGDDLWLPTHIDPGQHLLVKGALHQDGQLVLRAGTVLTPLALSTAASCGLERVTVLAPPSLAVVTTGDELGRLGAGVSAAQIYDSNGPMLEVMARRLGVRSVRRLHAGDDPADLSRVLEQVREVDVLVLSGGVSMGRFDFVPQVLRTLGAEVVFHKVRQKPGKPLLFACRNGQLVFALPGTPLGSHLGFHRYVGAALRKLMGRAPERSVRRGRLAFRLEAQSGRTLFRLARAERSASGWVIDPLIWRGSSDLFGPAAANCYVRLAPGAHALEAGTELSFELTDELM